MMIIGLFFTTLAAFANDPAASIVTGVINLNQKLQMNSCQCDAAPYQIASTDRSNKNMCAVITALGKGNPALFDTKNPYGLCAPNWQAPTPEWQRPEIQNELQSYATSAFVPSSRAEHMLRTNQRAMDQTARTALIKQTNDIKEGAAKACCGTNEDCLKTMRRVRVSVCSSTADQDVNQPDPCEAVGGSYNLTAQENASITLTLQTTLGYQATTPIEVERALREARNLLGQNSLFQKFPAEGEIILSPYVDANGVPISQVGTLHHEFGHACSFIRRQIDGLANRPHSQENAMSLFQARGGSCLMTEGRQATAYGPLLKNAGASDNVSACLLDLAKKSIVESSSAFISNSCQVNKIEEATAEAFAFYTLPIMPDAFPDRACHRRPSKLHPASTDVFTCVIKGDSRKRRELAAKYACEGVR